MAQPFYTYILTQSISYLKIKNSQLEKAREATDAANLRAAYAEVMTQAVTGETVTPKTVTETQKSAGWDANTDTKFPENFTVAAPTGSGSWTVTYASDTKTVTATHS